MPGGCWHCACIPAALVEGDNRTIQTFGLTGLLIGFSFLVAWCVVRTPKTSPGRALSKCAAKVGFYSYSIYLWQTFVLAAFEYHPSLSVAKFWIYIATTIFVGIAHGTPSRGALSGFEGKAVSAFPERSTSVCSLRAPLYASLSERPCMTGSPALSVFHAERPRGPARDSPTARASMRSSPHRNESLDVLRCIAVLLVVGHHLPYYALWGRIGWIGVDLFFVLSGFLISGVLFHEYKCTGTLNIKRFLIRRGLKIYPSFYLLMVAATCIYFLHYSLVSRNQLVVSLFFLQNYGEKMSTCY